MQKEEINMFTKCCEKYTDWSIFVLRLGVGLIFLVHGVGKLFGIGPIPVGVSGFAGMLGGLGIAAPIFWSWVVSILEAFGGLFILIGLFTRYSALLIGIVMIVAIFKVHFASGFNAMQGGYEYALLTLFVCIALMFSGAGKKLVLEHKLFGKEL